MPSSGADGSWRRSAWSLRSAVDVDVAQQRLEGAGEVRLVVDDALELGGVGHLAGLDEVPAADVERVDAQLRGHVVDHALDEERRLGPPRAAVRRHGRGVGGDRPEARRDLRDLVAAAGHERGEGGQPDAARVRPAAAVLRDPHPQREEVALVVEPDVDVLLLGPAVDHRGHVLAAGLEVLDRAPQPSRQLRGEQELGVERRLRTEAAADVRRDDAHFLLREPEHLRELVALVVRGLRGRVEGEAAGLPVGEAHRGLHRAPRRSAGCAGGSRAGAARRRARPRRRRRRAVAPARRWTGGRRGSAWRPRRSPPRGRP